MKRGLLEIDALSLQDIGTLLTQPVADQSHRLSQTVPGAASKAPRSGMRLGTFFPKGQLPVLGFCPIVTGLDRLAPQ
jgi:hypothetical protein